MSVQDVILFEKSTFQLPQITFQKKHMSDQGNCQFAYLDHYLPQAKVAHRKMLPLVPVTDIKILSALNFKLAPHLIPAPRYSRLVLNWLGWAGLGKYDSAADALGRPAWLCCWEQIRISLLPFTHQNTGFQMSLGPMPFSCLDVNVPLFQPSANVGIFHWRKSPSIQERRISSKRKESFANGLIRSNLEFSSTVGIEVRLEIINKTKHKRRFKGNERATIRLREFIGAILHICIKFFPVNVHQQITLLLNLELYWP